MLNKNKKNELYYKEKLGLITQNYSFPNLDSNIMKYSYLKYIILFMTFCVLFFKRNYIIFDNPSHIHIAMSLNDNYTYPIMVSITSILLNSNKNTFIQFHLLIGNDVKIENQNKILSLKNLNNNTNFSFHNVGNNFNGWIHGKKKLTVASFYRSILAELIKNVDKIIYLDGDTLTYGDISEMYQLNMDNIYFRGIREILPEGYEAEIDQSRFICAGVMLMNLKLIREDHLFETFKNYYLKFYNKQIYYGDQHIINALFREKINFLPPKFGTWFMTGEYIKKYKYIYPYVFYF
jgi:lipopolysaccharide biosynthesis glycosyltransferase